jgi:hypothetical protein
MTALPGTKKPKLDKNALVLKKINDSWKGNSVSAATYSSTRYRNVGGGVHAFLRKSEGYNVLRGFEVRQVDEKWWSSRGGVAATIDLGAPMNKRERTELVRDQTHGLAHRPMRQPPIRTGHART